MRLMTFTPDESTSTTPDIYCPQCSHYLADWEIHLLKEFTCQSCHHPLDMALPVRINVVDQGHGL